MARYPQLLVPNSPTFNGNVAVGGTLTVTGQSLFGDGTAAAPSISFSSETTMGFFRNTAGAITWALGGGGSTYFRLNGDVTVAANSAIQWSGTSASATAAVDTILVRDAANVIAQKNGTTAQTARIYGTTTNSKYLQLTHDGTNGILTTSGGLIGFGVQTTSAGKVFSSTDGITGYLTIVDAGGTTRKIAVIT